MTNGTSKIIGASTTLKNAHVWEVTSPLPLNPRAAGGKGNLHFMPAQLTPGSRRRRISIEVHNVKSAFESTIITTAGKNSKDATPPPPPDTEICFVRILERRPINPIKVIDHEVIDPMIHNIISPTTKVVKKGTVNFFTGSLRQRTERNKKDKKDDDSDDESVMASYREQDIEPDFIPEDPDNFDDDQYFQECHRNDGSRKRYESGVEFQPYDGWKPKYKLPLRVFNIIEKKKRSVVVGFESKGHSSYREFVFDNEAAMEDFVTIVKKNTALLESRTKARVDRALGGIKLEENEELTILFDIGAGSKLPQADIGAESDPYITVRFNGKKIHKTDYFSNNPNPIWTLRKGGLFIWKVNALDLFQSEDGLIFEVKDYDTIGKNESLGAFNVNARTLYKWNGERREFALKPLLGQRDFKQGKVSLRARRATQHDIDFLDNYKQKTQGGFSTPSLSIGDGTVNTIKSMMTMYSKKEKEGPDKGKTKYLIRPGPDPKHKEETSWLTKEQINDVSKELSYEWIDIGSGTLGKIFVEIIACDNLPNMDVGGVLGNKTDCFVSLVYEDCFAETDIIDDCLSPRWMPWSKRAFIFNTMHTSSQLFLAVFDSDAHPMSSHDLIGRISIDLSNFMSGSTYNLHYNLFPTAVCSPRENKFGTISLRLRIEMEDERALLLSNFALPQSVYVNVHSKKELEVIKQTVEGGIDTKKYSLKTINSHVDELMSYLTIYYALVDAFLSLILWRGVTAISMPVPSLSTRSIKWTNVFIPLHSLVAFICTVSLVENPDLLPSFYFGCVGWVLLACVERRANNPSPWGRSLSFIHLLSALILGKNIMTPHVIKANEGLDSVTDAESFWQKRVRDAEDRAKKRAEEYAKEQEQYLKDLEEIGDTNQDLSAFDGVNNGFALDPTRAYLFPIQQYLRVGCIWLRVFKNILVWEECYISFWVTMASFVLSVVAFFIPWGFLIKWFLRIIVWTFFGPWMKVADIYYFRHLGEETDEQKSERMNQLQLERQKRVDKQKLDAQIGREKAAKLRDFKQYMFGEHICRVNILKKDRYYDVPLPSSSAELYNPKAKTLGELAMDEAGYRRTRVNGQQLVGDMIPTVYETPNTEAPTGKPTKNTDLLDKRGSLAIFYDSNDSYSTAAIKVGSILVGALAITVGVFRAWYAVTS